MTLNSRKIELIFQVIIIKKCQNCPIMLLDIGSMEMVCH